MIPGAFPILAGGVPDPSFTGEYYVGTYVSGTTFTQNLTTPASPYRYILITAQYGQAATSTQYAVTFVINGVSVTQASRSVSNDGNSSASDTTSHTLVRIPTGSSITIRITTARGTGSSFTGSYQIGILSLPFANYTLTTQTGGTKSEAKGPFSISETKNGVVLGSFTGAYGTSAAVTFTGITRVPGNAVKSMACGYGFSTSTGTRTVSCNFTSTDGRVSCFSSWTAS